MKESGMGVSCSTYEEMRNAHGILIAKVKLTHHLGDVISTGNTIILKRILEK
jgi:hypothetical protein